MEKISAPTIIPLSPPQNLPKPPPSIIRYSRVSDIIMVGVRYVQAEDCNTHLYWLKFTKV